MRASFNGHLDVVKKLIKAGAKVNQTDEVGIFTCRLMLWVVAMASCNPSHVDEVL